MNEENYGQSYGNAYEKTSQDSQNKNVETKESPKTSRLFSTEGFILIFISVLLDITLGLINIIPVVGWIINAVGVICATAFFIVYDKIRGTNISKRRKNLFKKGQKNIQTAEKVAAKSSKLVKILKFVRPVVEIIPEFSGAIPMWTVTIIIELAMSKD